MCIFFLDAVILWQYLQTIFLIAPLEEGESEYA